MNLWRSYDKPENITGHIVAKQCYEIKDLILFDLQETTAQCLIICLFQEKLIKFSNLRTNFNIIFSLLKQNMFKVQINLYALQIEQFPEIIWQYNANASN